VIRYQVTHRTTYDYADIVPICHNLLHLTPRSLPHQLVEKSEIVVEPKSSHCSRRVDYFGNSVEYLQIEQPHRSLTITAISTVSLLDRKSKERIDEGQPPWDAAWEKVAEQIVIGSEPQWYEAYQYIMPSPRVVLLAEAYKYAKPSFTPGRGIIDAATDLMHRIHKDFKFDSTASNVLTPTEEVFRNRRGVCQDFAHVQIACLRSMGLAARYVSGYLRTYPPPGKERLVGADASHAWISLFIGPGRWIELDPTNDVVPSTDHIVVAYGRDFSDVSPIDGVFIGGGEHTLKVSVDVAPLKE
jgi:transglutaminase-like putative cysteine protease